MKSSGSREVSSCCRSAWMTLEVGDFLFGYVVLFLLDPTLYLCISPSYQVLEDFGL